MIDNFSDNSNVVGKNIKTLRKCKGISQSELALNIGVSEKSIRRFEKGTCAVRDEILSAISQFFDVSMDTLFGTDGNLEDFAYRDLLSRRYQNSVNIEKIYYVGNVTFFPGIESYQIVGHTMWTLDGLVLRPVMPQKALQLSTHCDLYKSALIINSDNDACLFSIFGGPFIIETTVCERFFPEFLKPMAAEA